MCCKYDSLRFFISSNRHGSTPIFAKSQAFDFLSVARYIAAARVISFLFSVSATLFIRVNTAGQCYGKRYEVNYELTMNYFKCTNSARCRKRQILALWRCWRRHGINSQTAWRAAESFCGSDHAGSLTGQPESKRYFDRLLSFCRAYWWLGSRVVSVLDSGADGPGFKSQSRRCRVTLLGKLFIPIAHLFTKQQNW